MRLGLLGGTFDPIHVGHLDVAAAARRALDLDHVMLIPANVPPHRALPRASAAHRFAMAALAVQDHEALIVSDLEMLSDEASYTSTTLDRLSARGLNPQLLFLITGADAFQDIETWKHYPEILNRCHFAVVSRPGASTASIRGALPALADRIVEAPVAAAVLAEPRVILIDAPTAPVSSTEVRRRVAAGESIHGLVPAAVERHIVKHHLYASS